ncbi:EPIDERMAL PATTERNING FACTOR-like protein 6 [Brachypodium distachyon]|uniref:Epidermal patterning factor-like protein n=1 Tax=Brachypodium distachyon TaxID=15368 RepID=I1HIF8_BRADI|nr:EPIDERMAL PATTERNING FACTOR-like protein 6 [Brachypodium distachyon]KQK05761.1 hypothetical protein BRADI_2g22340v3 [Brachypodium distachyon]|eukprot:XP_014753883.1 EPIDERMAL PATTERNING FACTOR-like protein 6 [Brachypodium distachyon]
MPSCTGSRRPRRGGGGGGSVLRLLVVAVAAVVAFLCGGCFVAGCWGTGVLRSDSGRMAGGAVATTHAGDLEGGGYYEEDDGGRRQRRRLLSGGGHGPGSHPPRCASKCGSCTPCSPVHVSVPPGGVLVTTEYYPEAWRCKCRDRLYMP